MKEVSNFLIVNVNQVILTAKVWFWISYNTDTYYSHLRILRHKQTFTANCQNCHLTDN